jgi:hypothetical protein
MLSVLFSLVVQATQAPAGQRPSLTVSVRPANPTVVVGDSIRLTAEVRDSAGHVVPTARIRWLGGSFEGGVDSTGMVKAGAVGTFVAYAVPTVDGRPSRPTPIPVRILPQPAARVTLSYGPSKLVVGQRLSLDAQVYSANGDRRRDAVTWSSTLPVVTVVSSTGRVTAIAPGRAVIRATAASSPTVRAEIPVEVVANTIGRVEITGGAPEARTGDVLRFKAVALSRDGSGKEIAGLTPTWSMAPGSGLIDTDGAFVANEPGQYTISASFGSASGDVTVRVRARDVRRVATKVGRAPLAKQLTAEFWPHPDGKHAYLSTIGDRLYALDISNPAAPTITDSLVVDARVINDVMSTADGKYGVMTREEASSRRNGIIVLSLEDPAHPKQLAEYTETVSGGVHSTYVYTQPKFGTHVYLTDDATGSMRVIDLNDPKNPKEIARWQTERAPTGRVLHDIDVRDGLAYLSYWNDGLVILDVGNGKWGGSPNAPKLVSQLKYDLDDLYRGVEAEGGPGFIRGTHTAWRHGNYVFVGDEVFSATPQGVTLPGLGLGKANGRLHVIDVSDLTKPREVAWYEPKDGGTHNVWVAGDTLYLGDYQGGLRVVDISGELRGDLLAQDREIAHVHTGDAQGMVPNAAMAWGAFYHNGLVWVNDVFSGLWAIRIEPAKKPVIQ